MKQIRFFLPATLLLLAVGCIRLHSRDIAPSSTARTQPHGTDCAIDEQHYQSLSLFSANPSIDAQIERVFQNVIHRDCNGSVIKQGIETVQTPTRQVNYRLPSFSGMGAVRLFNATSCDWSTAKLTESISRIHFTDRLRGNTDGDLEITLDASLGLTSFHVKPGVNQVYYTLYSNCVPDSERHTAFYEICPASTELSSGSFTINVTYSKNTLSGDKTVVDCSPNPVSGSGKGAQDSRP